MSHPADRPDSEATAAGGSIFSGRYEIVAPISSGAMGAVYRAIDRETQREVAIKRLLDVRNAARFEIEARLLSSLNHPRVVKVIDHAGDEEGLYIVMELVRGRSLDQLVKTGGALSPEWAASIGLFVLSALANAHALGVLHRDVKPGNVLLADDGRILLSDFGIATQSGGPHQGGAPVGTPGYTAPECLTETPDQLAGPAYDLWSLGATIYTAVEGVPPFQRNTAMAMHGAVMTEAPRPPQRAGALGPILLGLLAKNPAQRPDATTLRHALQRLTGQAPQTARTPSTSWVVSKLTAYGSAAAALVAFVVAVTLILVSSSAPATPAASGTKPSTKPSATASAKPGGDTPTSAAPSSSPSASPAVTHTHGKITAMPRPCPLLTRQQATQLVGRYLTSAVHPAVQCTWATADNTLPDSQQHALYSRFWWYPLQGDGYETQLAHEQVEGLRAKAEETAGRGGSGQRQGEVFEIPGAGEEAFAYELEKTDFGGKSFEVHVVFRTGNMVGEFRFAREVPKDPKLRDKAAQAAKWVVENINRGA